MLGRFWIAPLGLFLLQAAPIGLRTDSEGRVHLAVGASLGSYDERSVDCEGVTLARQRFRYRSAGAEITGRVSREVRVNAHAGFISTSTDSDLNLAAPYHGAFGGVLAVYDGTILGAGFGLSFQPRIQDSDQGSTRLIIPMIHARLGKLDGFHLLVETGGTMAPGSPPDLARIGLGFGPGPSHRTAFRADMGVGGFPEVEAGLNLGALVQFPVGEPIDLGLTGVIHTSGGVGVGVFGSIRLSK